MNNIVYDMITDYKNGVHIALPSYCTGNKRVIEAILKYYSDKKDYVLLEATSNQVNQFGGYTGLKPADYKKMVFSVAKQIGFDTKRILLGGDHLGPLVWCKEPEAVAMQKAVDLVTMFVRAGYQKIHLDTSMRLADDLVDKPLSTETIARRGALLFKASESAFLELKKEQPDAVHPVYIIGSEVPIPGGASGEETKTLNVTRTEDFISTIDDYEKEFKKQGIEDAFNHIVGVVVQPGVEFDNDGVIEFVSEKARALSETILQYKRIIFEGHSTDYQTPYSLRKMVESGVFILKVGPALTFAYREALTGMEKILNEINGYHGFSDALLAAMNDNDANWQNHYVNNAKTLQIYQQYSFSDRCRYYLGDIRVKKAIEELKDRFNKSTIPLFLVHQFLPFQYCKIRDCNMKLNFDAIVDDMVSLVLDNYRYASGIDESRNFYV